MSYGDPYGRQQVRRGPNVNPGIGGRMIVGVIIAIIALIGYFSKTEVNPVTGETQRVGMGTDQEMALGLKAAPQMANEMGGALDPRTNADAARVAEVGRKLAYDTEAKKSPYADKNNFNFYLLNDGQTINAFALPGGQIFITRALYNKLQNEAQLAGVLGHEVGHVIHRHGAEHMAKGQLGQGLVTAVVVGASDQQQGQFAAMAAQMANQMLQLKYGRTDELESDAYGMRLMAEIGYDPAEMLGVMQVLAEASNGNKQPEILLTHPYPDKRMEQIKQILAKYGHEWSQKKLSKGPSLR